MSINRRDFLKIGAVAALAPISVIRSQPPKPKAVTAVNADDCVIENTKSSGISILVPDNNLCSITFGSPDYADFPCDATIRYTHPADDLLIAA